MEKENVDLINYELIGWVDILVYWKILNEWFKLHLFNSNALLFLITNRKLNDFEYINKEKSSYCIFYALNRLCNPYHRNIYIFLIPYIMGSLSSKNKNLLR